MNKIPAILCWWFIDTACAFTFHTDQLRPSYPNNLHPLSLYPSRCFSTTSSSHLSMTQEEPHTKFNLNDQENDDDFEFESKEEEDQAEPGMLQISEIKAELQLRGVNYSDCFDRESLEMKLRTARATGKADPSILEDFNSVMKPGDSSNDSSSDGSFQDQDIHAALGNDGKLPGGMSPEMVQTLMSNPELMTLLKDPKMQECMKIIMTEGQDTLEEKMTHDEDLRNKVIQLNRIMGMGM